MRRAYYLSCQSRDVGPVKTPHPDDDEATSGRAPSRNSVAGMVPFSSNFLAHSPISVVFGFLLSGSLAGVGSPSMPRRFFITGPLELQLLDDGFRVLQRGQESASPKNTVETWDTRGVEE